MTASTESVEEPFERLVRLTGEITLAENFSVEFDQDEATDLWFCQIVCWRKDVVTGEMGYGYGGHAPINLNAPDSALIHLIFGRYLAYWEHEARETFEWRGRRIFGPHIDAVALWEVAERTS